jgi:hypothetical protein
MMLADCANRHSLRFGVTAEIHSSPVRVLTQEWAAAFVTAGFDGVRFLLRHDPGQQEVGIALFGTAGQANWHVDATDVIVEGLISAAETQFGIRVR